MNNICAPNKFDKKNNTCFTQAQLLEMAKAYNRYITKTNLHPTNKKFQNASLINIKDDKPYLLKELLDRFKEICDNDQVCLTKQDFMNEIVGEMKDDIETDTFRPIGPDEPIEWLSTMDINDILSQYESIYPDFKFLGAVPLDCNDVSYCSLYELDFDKYLKKGIKKTAVVFNLDKHGQPGSHWMALYIDIGNGEIYFCDSNGRKPMENISEIINKFKKYYKDKTGTDVIYKYNSNSYQHDGSECGIYSTNFIIRMLSGEKFDSVVKNNLSFEQINSCRNVYFRNKPSKYKIHPKCDPAMK